MTKVRDRGTMVALLEENKTFSIKTTKDIKYILTTKPKSDARIDITIAKNKYTLQIQGKGQTKFEISNTYASTVEITKEQSQMLLEHLLMTEPEVIQPTIDNIQLIKTMLDIIYV